jgi:hypothetical protein
MGKANVYFIMYLVLLAELITIITERDILTKHEVKVKKKLINSIGNSYKNPVFVNAQQGVTWVIGSETPATVVINNVGLVSDEEKKNVKYTVEADGSAPANWQGTLKNGDKKGDYELYFNPSTGDAEFRGKFSSEGKFKFKVTLEVDRVLPEYLIGKTKTELEKIIGNNKHQKATSSFSVDVSKKNTGVQKQGAVFY